MHVVAEAERLAFAERNRFLGDGDCAEMPLASLLAPAHLAALGASILSGRVTRPEGAPADDGSREGRETTHLSVGTADGEAVALTYTLNDSFGNGAIVPGVGVLLNNEMDDFTTRPGRANLFGLVQGEANVVRPGARPLSSMTPAIVLRGERPLFVLGSPGGSTIPSSVLEVLLGVARGGLSLAGAVEAPRFHQQDVPDRIEVEIATFRGEEGEALRRLGHAVVERRESDTGGTIGRVHAIAFSADGRIAGVADPRGYGAAVASP